MNYRNNKNIIKYKNTLPFLLFYDTISTSEKVIYRNGALAQLGARLNGIQKVTGSNPVCSIIELNLYTLKTLFRETVLTVFGNNVFYVGMTLFRVVKVSICATVWFWEINRFRQRNPAGINPAGGV